jgi:hypothetical protein
MPPSDRYREFLETTHYGSPEPLNLHTVLAPIAHRFITSAELKAKSGKYFATRDRVERILLTENERQLLSTMRQAGMRDDETYNLTELSRGMRVEMEHKDVTGGDPVLTAKIVLAHLREEKDYYTRLKTIEKAFPIANLIKRKR